MQRLLITLGVLLLLAGIAWPWLSKLPFGRLPGDIHVQRDWLDFYFPLSTGLVISVLVSLVIWWFRK